MAVIIRTESGRRIIRNQFPTTETRIIKTLSEIYDTNYNTVHRLYIKHNKDLSVVKFALKQLNF